MNFVKAVFIRILYVIFIPFSELGKKRRKKRRQIEREKELCKQYKKEVEHLKRRVSELERMVLWNQIINTDQDNSKDKIIFELKVLNKALKEKNQELERRCLILSESLTRYARMKGAK